MPDTPSPVPTPRLTTAGEAESAPPGQDRRSTTGRDMTLSLIVLLIPVALIVGFLKLRGMDDVVVVDPASTIADARRANLFPVAEPTGLESGWRPIRSVFTASGGVGTLRVGYITPSGGAVQLLETNEDPQALLPSEFGPDIEPTGQVDASGVSWRSYRVRGHEQALVLTTGDRTTIVQGQATPDELRTLADSVS